MNAVTITISLVMAPVAIAAVGVLVFALFAATVAAGGAS